MKKTLLEITQDILNDLDSDAVNSIDDTVESGQVAQIIRSCYEELISNRNWPHLKKLVQLEASGVLSRPSYLKLPEGSKEMISFKYNKQKDNETKIQYVDVTYKYPDEFLTLVNSRNTNLDTVQTVVDSSGVSLAIINNKAPEFWTTFDDKYIVCDSYDSVVDSTLKKAKTQAMIYIEPVWHHVDSFIPDLPSEAFSALIEESKSTAFIVLKQMANQKSEQKAGRQQRWLARKAWQAQGGIRYPNYGRKGLK